MIIDFFKNLIEYDNKDVEIFGWVETVRVNKKIGFIELNDGSTVKNLQLVIKNTNKYFSLVEKIVIGTSIKVKGKLKCTPGAAQEIELEIEELNILSLTNNEYPIQKQFMNLETLREIPHVRHRTKYLRCVMLIRSKLAQNIHEYFSKNNFLNMHSPIITSNDGEGAGEAFNVFSENEKNFFGNNNATLGVTGQLHAESYAIGFTKVYTFAPTFRAENSNTKKHLAEFWMIEPEVAFYDLKQIISLADDLLKKVIFKTIKDLPYEFEYLDQKSNGLLIEKLNKYLQYDLKILEYKDAIKVLEKNKKSFEIQDIKFGMDLATEHERFLCEKWANAPVAIINYPKEIKAFYMYQNDDKKTVAAFDLLVPGIGELVGGSQRESRYDLLLKRVREIGISEGDIQWYLDLRKFGDSGSSGFGVGFERLVMYCTDVENIRDSIPYPRTVNNLRM
ncbi:asparagine--tRNA ligase [Mycoplasma elephantis]|uniref:asparagine--tRNA ligase n=1 Tax=Mycoplasma elephantis TaxID=114882 RepID=UPI00047F1984|nr:asparagine--tRNA ligase [Mycoplasma elephantis]